jgi:ABC-type Na+ efflux pump permease subunit
MNTPAIKAIVKKDVGAIGSSVQMWLPMIIVPLVFVVVYPLIILAALKNGATNMVGGSGGDFLTKIIDAIPKGSISDGILAFPSVAQQTAYLFLNYLFTPLFILIPVMTSSIISANSFAGEKEKKTLETLLFSPVGERDLLFAKIMAAFIPAQIVTVLSALVYGIVVDMVGFSFFKQAIFPSIHWLLAIFWLSPAISLFSIFVNVFISAKVKGFQEAQQLSIIVILPVIGLFIAQMTGLFFLGTFATFLVGLIIFTGDFLLLRFASRSFHRQKMFLSLN